MQKLVFLTVLLASATVNIWSAETPSDDSTSREHQFVIARLEAEEGNLATALAILSDLVEQSPDDPVLRFERASVLLTSRRMDSAEQDLRIAVAKEPEFLDAQKLLGRVLLDRSGGDRMKVVEALSHIQKAWELNPDDLGSGLTVAQILLSVGREGEAEPVLKTLAERYGDNQTVIYQYAQLLARLDRANEAAKYLERVIGIDPEFKPAVFQLADIYQHADDWKKAAEILGPIVAAEPLDMDLLKRQAYFYLRAGMAAESRTRFETILKANPGDDRAKYFLAESLGDLGEPETAEPLYLELLEKTPEDPELLVSFGINQIVRRNFDRAEKQFNRILDIPDLPEGLRRLALSQLAGIAHARGRYDDALESARKLLDNGDRPNLQAMNIVLDVLQRRKMWADAVSMLRPLWEKYPDNMAVRARWIESLYRAGDLDEGRKIVEASERIGFEEAMAAEQGLAQAEQYVDAIGLLRGLAKDHGDDLDVMFQLGAMLERSGQKAAAETEFLRLLQMHPEHAATLNYLGYMWADDGINLERAAEMIRKAVDLSPRNGAYIDSLGWVYFRLGRLDLAKTHLLDAAQLMPEDATVQQHLGDVLEGLGALGEALEVYRAALELGPSDEVAATLRKKISELQKRVAVNASER